MSERIERLSAVVRHLRDILRTSGLSIQWGVIFGSQARGDQTESSDTDILLVSSEFAETPGYERPGPILERWDYNHYGAVDVLCYTPEEYHELRNKNELTLPDRAIAEGLVFFRMDSERMVSIRSRSGVSKRNKPNTDKDESAWMVALTEHSRTKLPSEDNIRNSIDAINRAFSVSNELTQNQRTADS